MFNSVCEFFIDFLTIVARRVYREESRTDSLLVLIVYKSKLVFFTCLFGLFLTALSKFPNSLFIEFDLWLLSILSLIEPYRNKKRVSIYSCFVDVSNSLSVSTLEHLQPICPLGNPKTSISWRKAWWNAARWTTFLDNGQLWHTILKLLELRLSRGHGGQMHDKVMACRTLTRITTQTKFFS